MADGAVYNAGMDAGIGSTGAQIVFCNCPSLEVAKGIARQLVERRLAACVSALAPCLSIYRWQGKVCEEEEVPLMIKTNVKQYAAVEALIRELHPYELPEIIAFDIAAGLPAYLAWLQDPGAGQSDQQP